MTSKEQARRYESQRLRDEAEFQHHRMKRIIHEIDVALFGPAPLGYEPDRVTAIQSRENLRAEVTQERDELREQMANARQALTVSLATLSETKDQRDNAYDLLDHARDERDDLRAELAKSNERQANKADRIAELETNLSETQHYTDALAKAEEALRECCLLCGFDPSDGEGTSPQEVVTAVERKIAELEKELEELRADFSKEMIQVTEEFGKVLSERDQLRQQLHAAANASEDMFAVLRQQLADSESECESLADSAQKYKDDLAASHQREADLEEALKIADASADDQMFQKREAQQREAELKEERESFRQRADDERITLARKYDTLKKREAELVGMCKVKDEALSDLFKMMDEGLLVRDISGDSKPGYAFGMVSFVTRIEKAKEAIAIQPHDAPRPLLE